VKFATIPESIDLQSAQLLEIGKSLGLKGGIWQGTQAEHLWSSIQTGIWGTTPIGCKLGVRLTATLDTIATLDRETANTAKGVIHLNSGIGACALGDAKTHCPPAQSIASIWGLYIRFFKAPVEIKQQLDVWGYRGNSVPLMQQIKQQFDPADILNPRRCF
ncbi:MAG: FAD-binding oxidoreductase, partial [Chamaesiphon sp. CSU_1_12]|nr:FAD-binding oxidoreductase [Chamaesiphon sp. CSU_1_12]